MERLLRWTILHVTIFLALKVRFSSCQNNQQAVTALPTGPVHQEYVNLNSNNPSPTPQLMNTLLTIAAANGVLPELLPKIQPLQIVETPYTAQEVEHRNIVTAPMQQPTVLRHEQIFPHTQQIVSTEPYTHAVIPHHATAGCEAAARPVPIVPPIVISPGLNTQAFNPFLPPNLESPHPPVIQPKEELCFCSDHMASGHTPSSPPTLPMTNINTFDTSRLNVEPMCANSILTTENGVQYPVNLQISIPPPNVEPPRITFINAALPTASTGSCASTDVNTASYNNWFPYGYAPQPQPVIVKKRKSSLKDWLPLIIYSMLHKDRGDCRNNGCCCCPCKSKRGGTVPIPYPIPIPTNSPIITTGYSCVSNQNNNSSNHNCTKPDHHHHNHNKTKPDHHHPNHKSPETDHHND